MTEIVCQDKPRIPAYPQGSGQRGYSLSQKRISPLEPQEKGFDIASKQLEELQCLPMLLPARGVAALALLHDLPLLLLSAVAQPLAALLPYGCGTPLAGAALPILQQYAVISVYRQSHQCGERSNAAFGRQSAAGQTSLAPHDSKARLISVTTCRRFMAKPCTPHLIAQRVQLFKLQTANVRGRGGRPLAPFSWGGIRGAILFPRKENSPPLPFPCAAQGNHCTLTQ